MKLTFRIGIVLSVAMVSVTTHQLRADAVTWQDRVKAQTAIETVYWRHRTWPSDNIRPKPPLENVLPEAAIRAKVEDYLKASSALEKYWNRPISSRDLQAELARMARTTRDSARLQELFDALGGSPQLISECLARPALANRLIRSWYAWDERFQGGLRSRIEAKVRSVRTVNDLRSLTGGTYRETTWRVAPPGSQRSDPIRGRDVMLDRAEWEQELAAVAARLGATRRPGQSQREGLGRAVLDVRSAGPDDRTGAESRSLLAGAVGSVRESADAFSVTGILELSTDAMTVAEVSWSKRSFEDWWKGVRPALSTEVTGRDSTVLPVVSTAALCEDDHWTPTRTEIPDPMTSHTAVWTGSEMIVWGGSESRVGGRYDPATDTWTLTSTVGAPDPRYEHTAVWTGTEMIVWGGYRSNGPYLNTGGRYDPSTDSWRSTNLGPNVPEPRYRHTAIWTGSEMIVWGGWDYVTAFGNGSHYDPVTNRWTRVPLAPDATSHRYSHTAVWTGSRMIVWGGIYVTASSSAATSSGFSYDPASRNWEQITFTGAPYPRAHHTAVWTGQEMIIWGGLEDYPFPRPGGLYNPSTNTWREMSIGPIGRGGNTAVWTGHEMIIWGGSGLVMTTLGARYDPILNAWTDIPSNPGEPSSRNGHTAVWTGTEMIVWGGGDNNGPMNSGGRFDPVSGSWVPTSVGPTVPLARELHSAVWTGSEMIIWGGRSGSELQSGGRYDPALDSWTPTSLNVETPAPRSQHTAIWTGTEMIVWGGYRSAVYPYELDTGGRYNPATNSWSPTSVGPGCPPARAQHTAVWSGRDMIVWGGRGPSDLDSGGRYDPATDQWSATSKGPNAPSPRDSHTAVWTGTEMIVWGGEVDYSSLGSGGAYDPIIDSWRTVSEGPSSPLARDGHAGVWTGSEMIVWGGENRVDGGLGVSTNDGGRYDPATDQWRSLSVDPSTPAARTWPTAVWTGKEMIVWGGMVSGYFVLDGTGGRYDPALDGWTPMSLGDRAPTPRVFHTAVWTGDEMIVWGGQPLSSTGGRYCAPPCTSNCDDGNPCTDDACSSGACIHLPNTAACDDGNACTHDDRCSGGSCQSGASFRRDVCDDGNICTRDFCDPEFGCFHLRLFCRDGDPRTIDSCDPQSGCVFTPRPHLPGQIGGGTHAMSDPQ